MTDEVERIRRFLQEEVLVEADAPPPLEDHTPLLEGLLDSMGLLRLVSYLEEEFEVEIDDTDIVADNFRTVQDVARLVTSAREARPA